MKKREEEKQVAQREAEELRRDLKKTVQQMDNLDTELERSVSYVLCSVFTTSSFVVVLSMPAESYTYRQLQVFIFVFLVRWVMSSFICVHSFHLFICGLLLIHACIQCGTVVVIITLKGAEILHCGVISSVSLLFLPV